jgi:DNA-binding LacI/PurR family transcriptional regulator
MRFSATAALWAAAHARIPVPDRLAVTGWDDTDLAAEAGLTTVRQSLREQGVKCARLALGELAPNQFADEPWHVVTRRSHRS